MQLSLSAQGTAAYPWDPDFYTRVNWATSYVLDVQPSLVISEELALLRMLHAARGGLYDKNTQTFLDTTYALSRVTLVDIQLAQRVRECYPRHVATASQIRSIFSAQILSEEGMSPAHAMS